jgi:hypothetical protein
MESYNWGYANKKVEYHWSNARGCRYNAWVTDSSRAHPAQVLLST